MATINRLKNKKKVHGSQESEMNSSNPLVQGGISQQYGGRQNNQPHSAEK